MACHFVLRRDVLQLIRPTMRRTLLSTTARIRSQGTGAILPSLPDTGHRQRAVHADASVALTTDSRHVQSALRSRRTGTPTSHCNGPCGYRSRVADSRVQRLNHWAIKVPEQPSRLRLAGSLHYSPLFEIRAPGSSHFQPRRGASTHRRTRVTAATSVTDRAGIDPGSPIPESNA